MDPSEKLSQFIQAPKVRAATFSRINHALGTNVVCKCYHVDTRAHTHTRLTRNSLCKCSRDIRNSARKSPRLMRSARVRFSFLREREYTFCGGNRRIKSNTLDMARARSISLPCVFNRRKGRKLSDGFHIENCGRRCARLPLPLHTVPSILFRHRCMDSTCGDERFQPCDRVVVIDIRISITLFWTHSGR